MNNISSREKILIYVLATCILFFVYYSLFLNPMLKKIDGVKANIEGYNVEVKKIRNAETIIKNQKTEAESLKAALDQALIIIPDLERNPEISHNYKILGDANRVIIADLKFEEPIDINAENNNTSNNLKGATMYAVPATIEVLGDYNSIMNFISAIEKDNRFSNIFTVSMVNKPEEKRISATLGMNYYYSNKITEDKVDYDFNTGTYGKPSLFN